MIIFPDFPDIEVEEVEVAKEIRLSLHMTCPTASCPSCGTASSRIQSRYTRTLRDLPSVGRPIRLILHVRRFSVKGGPVLKRSSPNDSPISAVLMRNARSGCKRLVSELGLQVGGQAGADVGSELGKSLSRDTILRLVHQSEQPAGHSPRIIGLEDWAWKRRLRYGTLSFPTWNEACP
jgi:hypothetical protein